MAEAFEVESRTVQVTVTRYGGYCAESILDACPRFDPANWWCGMFQISLRQDKANPIPCAACDAVWNGGAKVDG